MIPAMNKGAGVVILLACMLGGVLNKVAADSKPGGDFSLTDQDNRNFELQQLRGNVVILFFGYTSCPDVCPSALGIMAQVLRVFEKKSNHVKGIFITVDPERDSPQILKEYTSYFSNQLQGLTGSREQIDKVTKQYRANYRISQNEMNNIVVDHSSNLYVIDKDGRLNTIVPFGMSINHIVNVVEWLLENQGA